MNMNLLAFGMPGGPEMILIFILVLLLFGAKKLPQLARGIGKSAGEFKKAKDEFETQIKSAADDAERTALETENQPSATQDNSPNKIADSNKDSQTESSS